MKVARLLSFAVFAIGSVMLFLVATGNIKRTPKEPTPETNLSDSTPRHPVTDKMVKTSDKFSRKPAHAFTLKDASGKEFNLGGLTASGPVVLIAVLDGCPCTTDSQPLFNTLAKRYDGKATFAALFTQGKARVPKWSENLSVKIPVLLDDDSKVCQAYGLENSVYTVLIRPDQTIEKIWPGYSQKMLTELDEKLAELTGTKPEQPFDVAYAPKEYSSGCTIYVGEATKENKDKNPGAHD